MTVHAERLAGQLTAAGRVRVRLDDLFDAWQAAAPELCGRTDRFATLAATLDELHGDGMIELPAQRSWDRSYSPPLPRFVTVPAARRAPRQRQWRTFAWRPELCWVAELVSLTDQQFAALQSVNRWLNTTRHDPSKPVPIRLRSAEVFGDEKLLDSLEQSSLFGPGKLTLELLGCRRLPTPLPAVRAGDGAEVLVVENVDPFWAVADAVAAQPGCRIGWVVWGHGNEFSSGARALAEQFDAAPVVWYWGDLDPEGVRIAARAGALDTRIRPHAGLWSALGALEATEPGCHDWTTVTDSWLGAQVWAATRTVRAEGGRVAQERLPVDALAACLAHSFPG